MEQIPHCESNSHSASQEFLHRLWNPNVHYRVHTSMPSVHILSQINPIHTFPPCFYKILSYISLPSTPRSSACSLPFRFSYRNFLCIFQLSHACCILCSSHSPRFDRRKEFWRRVQVVMLLILHCSPASHNFLPLGSKYSPQHPLLRHPQSMFFP